MFMPIYLIHILFKLGWRHILETQTDSLVAYNNSIHKYKYLTIGESLQDDLLTIQAELALIVNLFPRKLNRKLQSNNMIKIQISQVKQCENTF